MCSHRWIIKWSETYKTRIKHLSFTFLTFPHNRKQLLRTSWTSVLINQHPLIIMTVLWLKLHSKLIIITCSHVVQYYPFDSITRPASNGWHLDSLTIWETLTLELNFKCSLIWSLGLTSLTLFMIFLLIQPKWSSLVTSI